MRLVEEPEEDMEARMREAARDPRSLTVRITGTRLKSLRIVVPSAMIGLLMMLPNDDVDRESLRLAWSGCFLFFFRLRRQQTRTTATIINRAAPAVAPMMAATGGPLLGVDVSLIAVSEVLLGEVLAGLAVSVSVSVDEGVLVAAAALEVLIVGAALDTLVAADVLAGLVLVLVLVLVLGLAVDEGAPLGAALWFLSLTHSSPEHE